MPAEFSPTGEYSPRQRDRARGYRLLAHAEIESFLEDIAKDALTQRLGEWKASRKASELLLCLLASYQLGFASSEDDEAAIAALKKVQVKERVEEVLNAAASQYMKRVNENHGIRLDNLRRLLIPVGVDLPNLDATWVTNMDEFGKRRGELAHKAVGAQQNIDPLTEFQYVKDLLDGLSEVDEIVQLLAST